MDPFEVQLVDEHTLRVVGELDVQTSPRLDAAIAQMLGNGGDVVLDMTDVGFIDSSGLHVLLAAAWALGDHRRLVVRRPSRFVVRVLEVSGLASALAPLPLEIEWADGAAHRNDGPGAVHRLAALVNASLDAARRSRGLTRDSLAIIERSRAARAEAYAIRAALEPRRFAA